MNNRQVRTDSFGTQSTVLITKSNQIKTDVWNCYLYNLVATTKSYGEESI